MTVINLNEILVLIFLHSKPLFLNISKVHIKTFSDDPLTAIIVG